MAMFNSKLLNYQRVDQFPTKTHPPILFFGPPWAEWWTNLDLWIAYGSTRRTSKIKGTMMFTSNGTWMVFQPNLLSKALGQSGRFLIHTDSLTCFFATPIMLTFTRVLNYHHLDCPRPFWVHSHGLIPKDSEASYLTTSFFVQIGQSTCDCPWYSSWFMVVIRFRYAYPLQIYQDIPSIQIIHAGYVAFKSVVSIHVVSKIQTSPKNKPRLTHLQMKQLKITPRKTWSVFNPQSQVLHNVVLHSLTSVSIHYKVFPRDKMSHDLSKRDFRKSISKV